MQALEITIKELQMAQEERKVGLKLFFGIFVMPYLFCWFLARNGYSSISRVMGFGWALIFVALLIGLHPF